MEPVKISVCSIVGSPSCFSEKDAEKVYEKIKEALANDKNVELSFLNVELLTPAFLNAAIGKLYGDFPEEKIKNSLFLSNITKEDRMMVKKVVETAKIYYKDPKQLAKIIKAILKE